MKNECATRKTRELLEKLAYTYNTSTPQAREFSPLERGVGNQLSSKAVEKPEVSLVF